MSDLTSFFGNQAFDPNTVEPQEDFMVLPPGKYLVLIEKAEVRTTKKNDGHFIYLELQVLDGKHKGRKLFDRINIDNPSRQCVEIGLRCMSALSRAIGLQAVSDDSQLINKTVVAHAKVKSEQNEIRTYSPAVSFDPNAAQVSAETAAPGPPVSPVAAQPTVAPVTAHVRTGAADGPIPVAPALPPVNPTVNSPVPAGPLMAAPVPAAPVPNAGLPVPPTGMPVVAPAKVTNVAPWQR